MATDRLGSVRGNSNGERMAYWPYGQERTSTPDGREKFGTYFRDGPGQDYASARYYNQQGAFWSPDPGGTSTATPTNPTTWNRYGYTNGDPINFYDPQGAVGICPPGTYAVYYGGGPTDNGCEGGFANGYAPGSDGMLIENDGSGPGGPSDSGGGDYSAQPCSFSAQDLQNRMLGAKAFTAQGQAIPTGAAGRPLAAFASTIMYDAVQDDVDPRLLVAIAFVEGKWGGDEDAARKQNSFGLHNKAGHLAAFTNILVAGLRESRRPRR